MSPRRRYVAIAAGALVLLASLAGWFVFPKETEEKRGRKVASITASAPGDVGPLEVEAAASPASPVAARQLPPPGAPLSRTHETLRALADAGHAKAACRLAVGLLRCAHLPRLYVAPNIEAQEARLVERGRLAAANQIAEEHLWRLETMQDCDQLPPDLRSQGARYLHQAARAGDPHAMLAYASGHHLDPSGRGMMAGPEFERWRSESPGMLRGALRAGNPSAAFALASAYQSDMGFPAALFEDNLYDWAVYHLLSTQLFGGAESTGMLQGLPAEQLQRARIEAGRMHREYFEGRRFDSSVGFAYPPWLRMPAGYPADCESQG